jgi:ADP-ribosylglycohydrolase
VYSLEACLWCFLNTGDYKNAVLKAVNLGEDTDTTAAITGGLVGCLYGKERIPGEWKKRVQRGEYIRDLVGRFINSLDNIEE